MENSNKRKRKTNIFRCKNKSCVKENSPTTEEVKSEIVGPNCRLRFTCKRCEVIWDACSECHVRFGQSNLRKADRFF